MDEQLRQVKREIATLRGELVQLRAALGAGDSRDAEDVIRQLVGVVKDLRQRVAVLEAAGGTIAPVQSQGRGRLRRTGISASGESTL